MVKIVCHVLTTSWQRQGSHNYFLSLGRHKCTQGPHYTAQESKIDYQKLQDKTEEYFDDLWDNNRERLSGISSSGAVEFEKNVGNGKD